MEAIVWYKTKGQWETYEKGRGQELNIKKLLSKNNYLAECDGRQAPKAWCTHPYRPPSWSTTTEVQTSMLQVPWKSPVQPISTSPVRTILNMVPTCFPFWFHIFPPASFWNYIYSLRQQTAHCGRNLLFHTCTKAGKNICTVRCTATVMQLLEMTMFRTVTILSLKNLSWLTKNL